MDPNRQPRSNWPRYFAAAVATLGGFYLVFLGVIEVQRLALENIHAYRNDQTNSDNVQKKAAKKIASECSVSTVPLNIVGECLAEKIDAYQYQYSTTVDAEAQQDMAYWAKVMAYLSGVGIIFSIASLGVLLVSLRQTRHAINISEEVGHAQVRAYITVEFLEFRSTDRIIVELQIRNNGQSPAYQVRYTGRVSMQSHPIRKDAPPLISSGAIEKNISGFSIAANDMPMKIEVASDEGDIISVFDTANDDAHRRLYVGVLVL